MRGSAGISPADAEREFGSSEGALDGGISVYPAFSNFLCFNHMQKMVSRLAIKAGTSP
jgi:hypothetical protein